MDVFVCVLAVFPLVCCWISNQFWQLVVRWVVDGLQNWNSANFRNRRKPVGKPMEPTETAATVISFDFYQNLIGFQDRAGPVLQ
jgi:hypothetical protein